MELLFSNNKSCDWLANKSKEEIKKLVQIAWTNKHDRMKKYKDRKEEIILDKLEKARLEKEIKGQRLLSEKEHLTSVLSQRQQVNMCSTI